MKVLGGRAWKACESWKRLKGEGEIETERGGTGRHYPGSFSGVLDRFEQTAKRDVDLISASPNGHQPKVVHRMHRTLS